jgi:hypothetical protein
MALADVRYIICHNPEHAERGRTGWEDAIARLEAELARIKTARERDRAKKPARLGSSRPGPS